MQIKHLFLLVCVECRGALEVLCIKEGVNDAIRFGQLRCKECSHVYEVRNFIPRFVDSDNYAKSFGHQWLKFAKTQYDSYTGLPITENRFFSETGWDRNLKNQKILEVGCGAGRFTEQVVSTGATIVSMDYSEAVDANYASHGERDNILIVQADIYHMPFKESFFNKIFCFGVLQHTPRVQDAFLELPRFLQPGGEIVIDVYSKAKGIRKYFATKYWVRPITRRIKSEVLYPRCEKYVSFMWPLVKLLSRIPAGKFLTRKLLLISNYHERFNLSEKLLKEWSILNTFDMFSPTYDFPQTIADVRRWFRMALLQDVDIRYGRNGICGKGKKR